MSLKPGQTLGQYHIVEQIGRGGMATVYRATQPSLSRQVAIKVLPEQFAQDASFHERFRQEATSVANLRHPNILTVFDSGNVDGVAFIVSELVDGGTLAGRLGKPLSVGDCVEIVRPIASALDYAHSRGIVHRDVKPGNILMALDGTPILSDFGLVRMIEADGDADVTRLTMAGMTVGTPQYMAPEQVHNSVVGPAADIYALAVVLYEMLTGSVPYVATTPLAVLASRMKDPLPLPRHRNPQITEAVQGVLLKGLADDPAQRYRSAGEMIRALDAAGAAAPTVSIAPTPASIPTVAALPVAAVPVATAPAPAAAASKRPLMMMAAIGGVLVAASAIAVAMWPRSPAPVTNATVPTTTPAPPTALSPPVIAGGPAAPTATASPAADSRGLRTAAPASTTPAPELARGALLFSLNGHAAELATSRQSRPEDTLVAKGQTLEFTATTDVNVFTQLPLSGIGDFVAVIRYTSAGVKPALVFKFHTEPAREGSGVPGHVVRLPTSLRLSPAGGRADGPHPCCQPFDIYNAPPRPGMPTVFGGPRPVETQALPNEEQTATITSIGPTITVSSNGREIARASDSSFGPGGMSVSVQNGRGDPPSVVRLTALDIYAPAGATPTAAAIGASAALPPHGRSVFAMASNLAALSAIRQQHSEDTIVAKGASLEWTAGTDTGAFARLPVANLTDFVAVFHVAAVAGRPVLLLRFHRTGGATLNGHVVQIPAYLRLQPPSTTARPSGTHACCQDLDIYNAPLTVGQPSLFTGPPAIAVPAPLGEEHTIAVSVNGPLIVVFADGHEIARVSDASSTPGDIALQVLPRVRGQLPAVLRLSAFEIFEVVRPR